MPGSWLLGSIFFMISISVLFFYLIFPLIFPSNQIICVALDDGGYDRSKGQMYTWLTNRNFPRGTSKSLSDLRDTSTCRPYRVWYRTDYGIGIRLTRRRCPIGSSAVRSKKTLKALKSDGSALLLAVSHPPRSSYYLFSLSPILCIFIIIIISIIAPSRPLLAPYLSLRSRVPLAIRSSNEPVFFSSF